MDARLPQEIQAELERSVGSPFIPNKVSDPLQYDAEAVIMGITFKLSLSFEAALQSHNFYRLDGLAQWAQSATNSSDAYRKSAKSWFELWTDDFEPFTSTMPVNSVPTLYVQRRNDALQMESQRQLIPSIQAEIVAAMKQGATFSHCHKEGGTNLSWRSGCYIRSDYGENTALVRYEDEAEFLTMLFRFYRWQLSRNRDSNDLMIWRLILRQMRP